jgi:hypothetical protein
MIEMRKAISLFLVFSILLLSGNLFAKERKGADLIVQRKDGTQVRGELIAVKENSLLLMERDSGADLTIDIGDISAITILKKSKYLSGAGLGFLIGAGAGAIHGATAANINDSRFGWTVLFAAVLGCAGALLGFIVAFAASGKTKVIQIEGKSDSEIKEILEKLCKKARIRNAQ